MSANGYEAAKDIEQHERWLRAIGELFMWFGEVEWFTYFLIVELPTERIFESVRRMRLSDRIRLVDQLMNERELDPTLIETITSELYRARDYADMRNVIAHNPLRVSLYADEHGDAFEARGEVAPFHDEEKFITLYELEGACEVLREINENLIQCRLAILKLNLRDAEE